MIQETGLNQHSSLYIYTDQSSYEPLARIDKRGDDPEKVMYFHTDLNGCPEELTDENGKILWECSFQLWGKRIHEIEHIPIQQNLRYQGQYLDRETGLHYNTFRYYDPDIGRFTQPDPIGLLGGFNLYQYAPNGLTWIDPWGLNNKLCAFGNKSKPREPRAGKDIDVDSTGMVKSQTDKKLPQCASTTLDPNKSPLTGHYHTIPEGKSLPNGLGIKRDGKDVIHDSPHASGHATIFPTRDMSMDEFKKLFNSIPWEYGGKKK
ncbi:RHS repeat domain-containing protein [Snodgrassella alvi]|uniref:Type IV secretion protein Rhs n=1 Tax=Snodgrassella alvi TaxID=1196083 RepID=A0A855FXL9_9NEIS|nr:RHS repeat-associated core domain-containing protein [Snodgrassella alvi]PIT61201.1 hypothetical protein BHC57_02105 [Snodgrassella alvi]